MKNYIYFCVTLCRWLNILYIRTIIPYLRWTYWVNLLPCFQMKVNLSSLVTPTVDDTTDLLWSANDYGNRLPLGGSGTGSAPTELSVAFPEACAWCFQFLLISPALTCVVSQITPSQRWPTSSPKRRARVMKPRARTEAGAGCWWAPCSSPTASCSAWCVAWGSSSLSLCSTLRRAPKPSPGSRQ